MKAMNKVTHRIFLSILPDTSFKEILEVICNKITPGGQSFYYIECGHLDASNPIYLDVIARKGEFKTKLLIPHSLVLMITDTRMEDKYIGFIAPQKETIK